VSLEVEHLSRDFVHRIRALWHSCKPETINATFAQVVGDLGKVRDEVLAKKARAAAPKTMVGTRPAPPEPKGEPVPPPPASSTATETSPATPEKPTP
jgi:hypothetical protein